MPLSLNYVSTDDCRQRRTWPARALGAAALVLVGVLLLPEPTVRQVESSVDAVTGTMTWKTVWMFGITSPPRIDVSPLERRLVKAGIPWTPQRAFLHNTHLDVFGRPRAWECGWAPPIHSIRVILEEFAAASTDDELREFVHTMESGTEAEQKAAVDAAGEKALRALRSSR
jgi:hypothetical protein